MTRVYVTDAYDDAPVIELARTDPAAAFAELYRRWSKPLLAYMVRRCGNLQQAEDICHTTWARAWKSLPHYRQGDRQYMAYLTVIACNVLRDEIGSAHNRHTVAVEPWQLDIQPPADSAEDHACEAMRERRRTAALDELGPALARELTSDAQRAIITLHYLGGLPLVTVAQTLGMTEAATKSAAHRARSALRRSATIRRIYSETQDMEPV